MTRRPPPRPVTWRFQLDRVVDGDTVRGFLERDVELLPGYVATVRSGKLGDDGWVPQSTLVRLVNLDTPERGEEGYARARGALAEWFARDDGERWRDLLLDDYGSAGFDRILGDLYVDGERGDTASQHMLRAGWEPWLPHATGALTHRSDTCNNDVMTETRETLVPVGRCGYCFAADGKPCTTRAGSKTSRLHNGRRVRSVTS